MKNIVWLMLCVGVLATACATETRSALTAEDPTSREVAVGRVVEIEGRRSYLVAEFPSGRLTIAMDRRELGRYLLGDLIRIDSFGRPLPRTVLR